MDPNQKNESPGQNQGNGPAESGVEQPEPPRKCKICGGPNHYGCGCEAKQILEAKKAGLTEREAKALHEVEEAELTKAMGLQEAEQQPESKIETADFPVPQPAPKAVLDWWHQKLTDEEREMANRLYDNFENISINLMDIVNLLKLNNKLLQVISSDGMAARATLQKMEAKMNNGKDTNQN